MKKKKREDWDDIIFTEEDNTEKEVKEESEKSEEPEVQEEAPEVKEHEREPEQEKGPALAQAELDEAEQQAVNLGMSTQQAQLAAENARLKAEIAALRQQSLNLQRTVGSASGAGKRSYDAFEEAWYDGN